MTHYVDGFVLPVPKKNVEAYRRMARKAGKIWRESRLQLKLPTLAPHPYSTLFSP
jgi:uncharacterized protein YbaA (DUF1428 family)